MHRLLLTALALLSSTAAFTTPVAARPGADARPGPFYDNPVVVPQAHGVLMRKRRYVGPLKVQGAIAGSSQGGHAALWAAEVAPDYTPDLTVTSTTAFAPPSHLSSQLTAARALPVTNLTATLALILRGADVADPSLRVRRVLTERAATLWPRQRFECQQEMASADAYGGVPANQLIRPTAAVSAILEVTDANGAESLAPPGPVLVLQGLRDMTVMPPTSAALVTRYTARGVDVTYRTYPDAAHGTVVADGGADATAFIATHLEGQRS